MNKNFGLGRGLDSLIPRMNSQASFAQSEETQELVTDKGERVIFVSPFEIEANPFQPRKEFNHHELDELVNSIKEHGIIQPLVVTKSENGYQLIAGERRLRSAQILELEKVPVIVREASSLEKLELALIENLQRSDLNPLEEALAYRQLADEFSLTQEKIAQRVGKNRATVANIMRVLSLPEEIQQALGRGQITISHAKIILSADTHGEQTELYQKCLVGNLNVEELTKEADKVNRKTYRIAKDLDLEVKEDKLRQVLGTKVDIKRQGEKGRVVIEFYSEEDLVKLVNQICG